MSSSRSEWRRSQKFPDIALLQTALCYLMTRYTMHPCPGIAYAVVNHLEMVIEHPDVAALPDRSKVYNGLLIEWRTLVSRLSTPDKEVATQSGLLLH